MDAIYPVFARADATFYDHPERVPRGAGEAYTVETPEGWVVVEQSPWTYLQPEGHHLPEQGWKVHVSCLVSDAETVLRAAGTVATARRIPFKHLSTTDLLRHSNAKDAGREGSGKFVTLYPSTERELHRLLIGLGEVLASFNGPHILSDLRWTTGPIFTRFGGFHPLFVEVDGAMVPAIRHPDGHLVADIRRPVFTPPEWVRVPAFLQGPLSRLRQLQPPEGFPVVTAVLQHSNAGGIYLASDGTEEVVLKEARPYTGFTPDGLSATERADREARTLRHLSGQRVSRLRREFDTHDHRYLVLEKAPGQPLHQAVAARHPLIAADAEPAAVIAYRTWAVRVAEELTAAVAHVHEAGFVHGDLHPGNILVDEDGHVTVIDFEMARPVADGAPAAIGAPGFIDPSGAGGIAGDLFALRRMILFLFAPVVALADLHRDKEADLRRWVHRRFFLDDRRVASWGWTSPPHPGRVEHADTIQRISRQLLADATPARTDRLWPGDPAQFDEPPYALAHGAFGPLLALHSGGVAIPEHLVEWAEWSTVETSPRQGLMDGLAGAVLALSALGREDAAERALQACLDAPVRWNAPGLYGGPAGTALAYVHLSARHPELLARADVLFAEVAERADNWRTPRPGPVETGSGGLLRGPSGISLLAMALYDRLQRPELLDLAEAAIHADIAACVPAADGTLQINEGWRLMPYLGYGSAGVAYALRLLEQRRPGSALVPLRSDLERAAQAEFVFEPGLFQGRAGMMATLAGSDTGAARRALRRHHRMLELHAIPRAAGAGYPGRNLLRLSCDLATGSAGVLWALTHPRGDAAMPFLDLPPVTASAGRRLGGEGGEEHGVPAFVAGSRA
ncbi:MAG: class III lanthionine synthetase LanKC [Microbacterium enclense]